MRVGAGLGGGGEVGRKIPSLISAIENFVDAHVLTTKSGG